MLKAAASTGPATAHAPQRPGTRACEPSRKAAPREAHLQGVTSRSVRPTRPVRSASAQSPRPWRSACAAAASQS